MKKIMMITYDDGDCFTLEFGGNGEIEIDENRKVKSLAGIPCHEYVESYNIKLNNVAANKFTVKEIDNIINYLVNDVMAKR